MAILWGIDFSGAAFPAQAIWIAEARMGPHGLEVLTIQSLAQAEALNPRTPVESCLQLLRKRLLTHRPLGVGLDFPFSLPHYLLEALDYPSWLNHFLTRFPSVDQFWQFCRQQRPQPMRVTDGRQQVPFSPCNLRLYRQTYWGIVGVLAPLWGKKGVRILPFQPFQNGAVHLLEICPASLLKLNGRYRPYKGREPRHRDQRHRIVQWLVETYPLRISPVQKAVMIEQSGGDALDALLGVLPPFQLLRRYGRIPLPAHPLAAIEGWIYTA